MELTGRAQRRAWALAKQISDAGYFIPCNCGLMGCYTKVTPRDRAQRIIDGQMRILKLDEVTIREALRQVQLI